MKSYLYRTSELAEKESKSIGCEGSHRVRKNAWKPCKSKKELQDKISDPQGEIDELIDYDGTMVSSKVPILDPHVSPKKTMDQTVAMTRTPDDPMYRGRMIGVGEIDMSKAFGWDDTLGSGVSDFEDVVKKLTKDLGLDKDDAEDRAEEFGVMDDKEEIILKEKSVDEDIVLNKSSDDNGFSDNAFQDILKRNIRSLKDIAKSQGISNDELIQMISNE